VNDSACGIDKEIRLVGHAQHPAFTPAT